MEEKKRHSASGAEFAFPLFCTQPIRFFSSRMTSLFYWVSTRSLALLAGCINEEEQRSVMLKSICRYRPLAACEYHQPNYHLGGGRVRCQRWAPAVVPFPLNSEWANSSAFIARNGSRTHSQTLESAPSNSFFITSTKIFNGFIATRKNSFDYLAGRKKLS